MFLHLRKALKEDEETIKKKQLDYLKEHEQKVIDLVKAQNSKVESVQIDWDHTQWSDGGLTTPGILYECLWTYKSY